MGSDGSEKKGIASFAWGLLDVSNLNSPLIMFKAPVHGDTDQVTPLRAELYGLFSCLYYLDYLQSKYSLHKYRVPVFSDCTNAILAATKPFGISCKSVFLNDSDIRAELRTLFKKLQNSVNLLHVKSHQNDTRPIKLLSPAGILNVSLDRYLKNNSSPLNTNHSRMIPHLPVQKVSLRHPQDRITNNFSRNINRYSIEFDAEQIISTQWKTEPSTMQQIHRYLFQKTMSSYPRFRQFIISKFVHVQYPNLCSG